MNFTDRFDELTIADLDRLSIGTVRLDLAGTVTYYNAAESELARRTAGEAVGLNFFRDLAPCTAVKNFQGRFAQFVASPDREYSTTFSFRFAFGWGKRDVTITLVRRADEADAVHILVIPSDMR